MPAKVEITNTIRKLRFENYEMTQLELAERVGVTRQTILALEAGKYTPSLALAFRIARTFNRAIDDVFTFHDEKAMHSDGTAK